MHLQNWKVQLLAATSQWKARTVVASEVTVSQSAIEGRALRGNRRALGQGSPHHWLRCRCREEGWAGGSPDMVDLSCSRTQSGACRRRILTAKACCLHRHPLVARFAAIAARKQQGGGSPQVRLLLFRSVQLLTFNSHPTVWSASCAVRHASSIKATQHNTWQSPTPSG